MFKTAALFAIATSLAFLILSPVPKPTYHSLFISPSLSDNASISNHLRTLTRRPHIAGSAANAAAALHVLSAFTSSGVTSSRLVSFKTALSLPVSRSLTLTLTPSPSDPPIEFSLRQENHGENPYADEVAPTFHAYAKSGAAAGPVVYANYGRVEDFAALRDIGVNVSGSVVLARYGEIYRGDIIRNAHAAGAVGVLVYTDKKDYGGERWFPADRWMPPSGVQVGTVYGGVGDPTTPGWPSTEGCERISEEEIEMGGEVPLIPSLPVSGADGEVILRSVGGHMAGDDWQGNEGGLVYRVGPGPGIVNLSYVGNQFIEEIQNVIGVIEGVEEPDRFVILGNHRDAWTFGAVDPNSGTAALIEVAERLGKLQKRGWKPRRTILLCNWDAEEYGLLGSTEWVEENRELLASRAVAYLNVDCAVSEPRFYASATPQLDELLIQATKQVKHPDNSSQTIYESWLGSTNPGKIGRLGGGGSDFAAFVQHIGVPAAMMSFDNGYPVYHSMYDDFTWMEKFGDPMFKRHVAVASVWGLVALWLADAEVLPFNYISYAEELLKYTKEVENEITGNEDISLSPLFKSIEELRKAATKINRQREAVQQQNKDWQSIWKRDSSKLRELNDRLMMAERAFTDHDGLLGRSWYKHLIYGPSKYNDYGSKSFPGIDDAIEIAKKLNTEESWKLVQHEIWRVARAVKQAAQVLNGVVT